MSGISAGDVHFPNGRDWSLSGGGARVSIVMRTKDRPVLLPRAIKAVLAQTHRDWTLHIVNDGGDSEIVAQCLRACGDAFADQIVVTHNPQSLGMEAASNVAITQASGDFLAFLDDDDTWHPEFLEETTRFLNTKENARFIAVTTRSVLVGERIEGDLVIEEKREDWLWAPMVDVAQLISRNQVLNNSLLIRMAAVSEIGRYNEAMPVLGDWDYVLRLLAVGDIGTIDKRLSHYHQRSNTDVQYGNTVTAGLATHKTYDALYRNSLVREALKNPATLGILHVLLRMMEEHANALTRRMVEHDTLILKKAEEHKIALLSQMVEHDTLILRTLGERFDRLDNQNAINSLKAFAHNAA